MYSFFTNSHEFADIITYLRILQKKIDHVELYIRNKV